MNLGSFYPPIATDYLAECIKSGSMEDYYRAKDIIEEASYTMGGNIGRVYRTNALDIIDKGLMRPVFTERGDGMFEFYFEIWSCLDGCFKHPMEMEQEESFITQQLMVYPTRRN